jgi:hypothetical protein
MEFLNNWIVIYYVLRGMFDIDDLVLYYEPFSFSSQTIVLQTLCILNLTCSISYGVGQYLNLWNVNKKRRKKKR